MTAKFGNQLSLARVEPSNTNSGVVVVSAGQSVGDLPANIVGYAPVNLSNSVSVSGASPSLELVDGLTVLRFTATGKVLFPAVATPPTYEVGNRVSVVGTFKVSGLSGNVIASASFTEANENNWLGQMGVANQEATYNMLFNVPDALDVSPSAWTMGIEFTISDTATIDLISLYSVF